MRRPSSGRAGYGNFHEEKIQGQMEQDCDFIYFICRLPLLVVMPILLKGRSFVVSAVCTITRSRCEDVSARGALEANSGLQKPGLPCCERELAPRRRGSCI
jgi:hypothetical protein